jgi:hypothetical protein
VHPSLAMRDINPVLVTHLRARRPKFLGAATELAPWTVGAQREDPIGTRTTEVSIGSVVIFGVRLVIMFAGRDTVCLRLIVIYRKMGWWEGCSLKSSPFRSFTGVNFEGLLFSRPCFA